jgi:hypothetical protein
MMDDAIKEEDDESEVSYATSHKMLGKLKNISAMAISVTTGKKLQVKKNPLQSNVIPGFGYALMDIFENQYVDMESISKAKDHVEDNKSPFKSPTKKKTLSSLGSISPQKIFNQSSITSKDDMRKARREEKKAILDEIERRERDAPKQH